MSEEKPKYDFYIIRGDQFATNVVHRENLDEMPSHTAPTLVDMYEDLWDYEKQFYGDDMPPKLYDTISKLVCVVNKTNLFFMFIYKYNDEGMKEMIGYMMFERWVEIDHTNHYDIKQFYIDPEYRHNGIGSSAIDVFLKSIRRWSATTKVVTSVDVHKKNLIALNFYHKKYFGDYHETLTQTLQPEA